MNSILITGASGGIGAAIAEEAAKYTKKIAITARQDKEGLARTEGILRDAGCEVLTFLGDGADSAFVDDVVRRVTDTFGTVDILVNNAGISVTGLHQDLSDADWSRILGVNLSSVSYYCRALIPHFLQSGSGRILNVSSVWGIAGASCEAAYAATKGGVDALTKSLGKELAPSHIPVNAIAYGAVDTKMNAWLSEEERMVLEEEIPYGRMATAEEAAAFAWNILTSPTYLTGQVIPFDGGWI